MAEVVEASSPFCCPHCDKVFPSVAVLGEHTATEGGKPHTCCLCRQPFSCKHLLQIHILTHAKRPKQTHFRCSECGKDFEGNTSLKYHMMTHTGERPHQCPKCDKKFRLVGQVNAHMLTHMHSKAIDKHAGHMPPSQEHMTAHPDKELHPCTSCDKVLSSKSKLKRHMMTHTGEKPYNCSKCGREFSRDTHLKRHLLSHCGQRDFKCEECGRIFTNMNYLTQHTLNCEPGKYLPPMTHKQEEGPPADNAERHDHQKAITSTHPPKDQILMNTQQKLHSKDQTLTNCQQKCLPTENTGLQSQQHYRPKDQTLIKVKQNGPSKASTVSYGLQTCSPRDKIDKGEEQKLYKCTECNKVFMQAVHLKAHALSHKPPEVCTVMSTQHKPQAANDVNDSGGDMYQCMVCNKYFMKVDHLRQHALTHLAQKNYTCAECGKPFTTSYKLKRHTMTHTGEKPFECSVCGRRFGSRYHLTEHFEIHTKKNPGKLRVHRCTMCMKTFEKVEDKWMCSLSHGLPIRHPRQQQSTSHGHHNDNTLVYKDETQDLYKCSECNKYFTHLDHLVKHELTHERHKPNVTRPKQNDESHRGGHRKTHGVEDLYICEQCNKCFMRVDHFREHALTHIEQDKDYNCTLCDMAYTNKNLLDAHMMSHTETIIMYPCRHCGQGFYDMVKLNEHIVLHTGQNYSSCAVCVKGFCLQVDLEKHLNTHVIVPLNEYHGLL